MKNTTMLMSALLLLGLSKPGYTDIMRCETGRVVSSGDTTAEVLSKCGEPTLRESRRECPKEHADKPRTDRRKSYPEANCVTVDTWTYDFGPRRLVHKLIFKSQRLDVIQTQGYGR